MITPDYTQRETETNTERWRTTEDVCQLCQFQVPIEIYQYATSIVLTYDSFFGSFLYNIM